MANEMKSFTFGGVTHPICDADAIKSAIMNGSTLELKDGDGTVKSSVVIPTGNIKYSEFKVNFNAPAFGELCYVEPVTGMQKGDFLYVEPKYPSATKSHGYWASSQQEDYPDLTIRGINFAPINQPLVGLCIDTGIVQYIPVAPKYTLEAMISDNDTTLVNAWDALTSWKPAVSYTYAKAAKIYKNANTEFTYDSAQQSNFQKIITYADGTYASLIPLASGQSSDQINKLAVDYGYSWTYVNPNPCILLPQAITATYSGSLGFFKIPVYPNGVVGECTFPTLGYTCPDNFAIVFGNWT